MIIYPVSHKNIIQRQKNVETAISRTVPTLFSLCQKRRKGSDAQASSVHFIGRVSDFHLLAGLFHLAYGSFVHWNTAVSVSAKLHNDSIVVNNIDDRAVKT